MTGTGRPAGRIGRPAGRAGLASFATSLVGLLLAIYLTVERYTGSLTLACPESVTINCQKVTTSRWSYIGPVSLTLLGLGFFIAMVALCSPPAWRIRRLDAARVGGAACGVLTALYLVWVELFQVNALCLWCTAVHLCSLVLLGTVLWAVASRDDEKILATADH